MYRDMIGNAYEEESSSMIKKESIKVFKKIENCEIGDEKEDKMTDEEEDEMADEDVV